MSGLSVERVKTILKSKERDLRNRGVKSLKVFGSVARNEAHPGSDVDMLVEFDERPIGLLEFIELNQYLEKLFGTKVDLVTEPALKSVLKLEILKESIRVA